MNRHGETRADIDSVNGASAAYHMTITNAERDDFVHHTTAIKVTAPSGDSLRWSLPDRLITNPDVFDIVVREMTVELQERAR